MIAAPGRAGVRQSVGVFVLLGTRLFRVRGAAPGCVRLRRSSYCTKHKNPTLLLMIQPISRISIRYPSSFGTEVNIGS